MSRVHKTRQPKQVHIPHDTGKPSHNNISSIRARRLAETQGTLVYLFLPTIKLVLQIFSSPFSLFIYQNIKTEVMIICAPVDNIIQWKNVFFPCIYYTVYPVFLEH